MFVCAPACLPACVVSVLNVASVSRVANFRGAGPRAECGPGTRAQHAMLCKYALLDVPWSTGVWLKVTA